MNFGKNMQHDFPKMRGRSTAVWNFSENSSVLVGTRFDIKNGKKGWHCPLSANTPRPQTGKKRTFVVWKKSLNRDKCVFATKQRMFRVLAKYACKWHFVVNLSVCIVHFPVIWGPSQLGSTLNKNCPKRVPAFVFVFWGTLFYPWPGAVSFLRRDQSSDIVWNLIEIIIKSFWRLDMVESSIPGLNCLALSD